MSARVELLTTSNGTARSPLRLALVPPGRSSDPDLGRVVVLLDLFAGALAWGLAGPIVLDGPRLNVLTLVLVAMVLTPLSMAGLGLYRSLVCASPIVEVTRTAVAGSATVALLLVLERAGAVRVDGVEAMWTGVASITFLLLGRWGFRSWLHRQREQGRFHRPIVLVGRSTEVEELLEFYAENAAIGYNVTGVVSEQPMALPPGARWLGTYEDDAALTAVAPTGVAVLAMAGLPSRVTNQLLRRFADDGVRVHLHSGLARISHRRLRPLPLAHEPLHYIAQPDPRLRHLAKRALDVVGASIALVLATPILVVTMALIRFEDGGPAIFRQRRVGARGVEFTMMKLRTMGTDAEARREELLEQNLRTGPLFKADVDPRITRVGRWLRALSIDEFPQLINVLRGEMSLVGPRPALQSEIALFDDELRYRRQVVRPGMTGLWQVEARDNPSIYAYRRLDLFYVDNWTISGDVSILARTAGSVIVRGSQKMLRGERR